MRENYETAQDYTGNKWKGKIRIQTQVWLTPKSELLYGREIKLLNQNYITTNRASMRIYPYLHFKQQRQDYQKVSF